MLIYQRVHIYFHGDSDSDWTSKHQIGRHLGDFQHLTQIREMVTRFSASIHSTGWGWCHLRLQGDQKKGEATNKTVPCSFCDTRCFKNFNGYLAMVKILPQIRWFIFNMSKVCGVKVGIDLDDIRRTNRLTQEKDRKIMQ